MAAKLIGWLLFAGLFMNVVPPPATLAVSCSVRTNAEVVGPLACFDADQDSNPTTGTTGYAQVEYHGIPSGDLGKCTGTVTRQGSVTGGLNAVYDYVLPGKVGSFQGPDSEQGSTDNPATIFTGQSEDYEAPGFISGRIVPDGASALAQITVYCVAVTDEASGGGSSPHAEAGPSALVHCAAQTVGPGGAIHQVDFIARASVDEPVVCATPVV